MHPGMSSALFISIFLAVAVLAALGLRAMMPGRPSKTSTPDRVQSAAQDLRDKIANQSSHLDEVDTVPQGVPLAALLAANGGVAALPPALDRRAQRLLAQFRQHGRPEPMRALAKLLVETAEAGLPDAYGFHEAARQFLANAPAEVLGEFAAEVDARLPAFGPWIDLPLSIAALDAADARSDGAMGGLAHRAEAFRAEIWTARVDELLAQIGHCAEQGRAASGGALSLTTYVVKRPELMPRVVSEMATHPHDPVWLTAWLMLETRALDADLQVNVPAFRNRVIGAFDQPDPVLLIAASDAAQKLLDLEAVPNVLVLAQRVERAVGSIGRVPPALQELADRLGVAASGHGA